MEGNACISRTMGLAFEESFPVEGHSIGLGAGLECLLNEIDSSEDIDNCDSV